MGQLFQKIEMSEDGRINSNFPFSNSSYILNYSKTSTEIKRTLNSKIYKYNDYVEVNRNTNDSEIEIQSISVR